MWYPLHYEQQLRRDRVLKPGLLPRSPLPRQVHRLMVGDKPRTEAYRSAILASRHLFRDKVVLDIGAGTGQSRARHVW